MAEIFDSRIGKVKKGARLAIGIAFCTMILGFVPMYLYKNNLTDSLLLLVVGIITFIWSILAVVLSTGLLIVYSIKLGNKSDSEAFIISKELEDPETVYIKECSTYLTPNYIVTLSTNPRVVKYSDIVRVYEVSHAIQLFTQMTFLRVKKRNGKTVTMAEMGPACEINSNRLYSIMLTLKEHNPNIEIGYSKKKK